MKIRVDDRWRVRVETSTVLPMGAATAWRHMRDFPTFACLDVFHRGVELHGSRAARGAAFDLVHGLAGVRIVRTGRILTWDEGRSYRFSDLSRRGPRAGFPHVYTYRLDPVSARRCVFRLEVRGRWTAAFLPRPLVRLWLGWVVAKTRVSVEAEFLRRELRRRLRKGLTDPAAHVNAGARS